MTDAELRFVFDLYDAAMDGEAQIPDHARTMLPQMRAMLDQLAALDTDDDAALDQWCRLSEKLMRWHGFLQGVLWCCGVYSLDALKAHNRGDVARFDQQVAELAELEQTIDRQGQRIQAIEQSLREHDHHD